MELNQAKLRKVALVVASLDPSSADQLLDQLPAETAQRVRNVVVSMTPMDAVDQRAALREFLGGEMNPPPPTARNAAMDRRTTSSREMRTTSVAGNGCTMPDGPAGLLGRAPERLIADCLCHETPQAIAVALAALPTDRASEVIAFLPDALQAEVLERLVEYDPSVALEWTEIRDEFHQWLNEQLEHALHRAKLASRLAVILEASHPHTRQRILHNVAGSDEKLARELQQQLHGGMDRLRG